MSHTRTLAGIAGLCVVALAATAAPVTTANASPTQTDRAADLLVAAPSAAKTQGLGGERSRAVGVDDDTLEDTVAGDRLTLSLFDDAAVTAVIKDRSTVDGVTTWFGGIEGEKGSFTAVEVGGVAHINVVSVEHGTYEVRSTGAGDYVVVEASPANETADDAVRHGEQADLAAEARTTSSSEGPEAPVAEADSAAVIDVAIVYPASLPAGVGAPAMEAQFAAGIAQTNQALAASGVGTQVRLVGTRQVASAQASTLDANYDALATPGDGVFDEAQALREETHADLVSLWLGGAYPAGSSCGLGSLGGTQPKYDPERAAWTVVWADQCATANLTFAHEIGHNLSADHDAGASSPPSGSKPYARGYVDLEARTTTVMAYNNQCVAAGFNCTRLGNYSNPNVAVNGRPTGTAAANNAQAIAEQVAAVASYRQSQIYPGAVTVTGRARFKGTAKAATTEWSPGVTLSYQWVLDGVAVAGATKSTFKLSRKTIGHSLAVAVTGSAPYYAPVATGSAGVVVGKALFKTKRPKLRGLARAGRTLSVSIKGWKPKPSKKSVKVRYQWLKNGKKIKGAKKSAYRVRAKDRGKKISVKVTIKKKNYEKTTRSSKKVKIRR